MVKVKVNVNVEKKTMTQEELQRLRQLPIEEVAERLGLDVVRGHRCLCPFHNDSHPSMTFHIPSNTFRCWSCGAHGDVIKLTMDYLHKTFPEACRWLDSTGTITGTYSSPNRPIASSPNRPEATTLGREDPARLIASYARFFERPFLSDRAKDFLFNKRRLSPDVVANLRLTSYRDRQGVEWLQTPYYDIDGRTLLAIQNRNLMPDPQPRFRFPPGQRVSIYNLPVLATLQPLEPLYITEGCSDCWALLSAGEKAIAIPSATLLTRENKALLRRLYEEKGTLFRMYPDRDVPGERLFLELKELLPNLEHLMLPPDCKDVAEAWMRRRGSEK